MRVFRFEKYAHSFTASTHVKDIIPSVLAREPEKVKAELQEVKEVSVIYSMGLPDLAKHLLP